MNPWIIDSVITVTKEAAKRNGFRLEPASDNRIALMANKAPYAKDICITRFEDWVQAQIWFAGYEQHQITSAILQMDKKRRLNLVRRFNLAAVLQPDGEKGVDENKDGD